VHTSLQQEADDVLVRLGRGMNKRSLDSHRAQIRDARGRFANSIAGRQLRQLLAIAAAQDQLYILERSQNRQISPLRNAPKPDYCYTHARFRSYALTLSDDHHTATLRVIGSVRTQTDQFDHIDQEAQPHPTHGTCPRGNREERPFGSVGSHIDNHDSIWRVSSSR
jgi:hypothetical protein